MLPTLKHFFDCIPVNALIKKRIYTKYYSCYKTYNLGLKDLLWRMHKHRSNRWRRWAYKLFKHKKYLEEYEGQL